MTSLVCVPRLLEVSRLVVGALKCSVTWKLGVQVLGGLSPMVEVVAEAVAELSSSFFCCPTRSRRYPDLDFAGAASVGIVLVRHVELGRFASTLYS